MASKKRSGGDPRATRGLAVRHAATSTKKTGAGVPTPVFGQPRGGHGAVKGAMGWYLGVPTTRSLCSRGVLAPGRKHKYNHCCDSVNPADGDSCVDGEARA
jgi:hypothetical protein